MTLLSKVGTSASLVFVCTLAACAQQPGTVVPFRLASTTEVPGSTLKSGAYTVTVVDALSDRTVLRVDGQDGKSRVLLLAVRNGNLNSGTGPVFWQGENQHHPALRGFVLQGGPSVELVYPKADAVALAKANHSLVVAVDTASEGRPELSKLSNSDMQMVSLWMLTPIRVSDGTNGIEAQHFAPHGPAVANASVSPGPRQPAASAGKTPSVAESSAPPRAQFVPVAAPARSPRVAPAAAPPRATRLPQTAGDEPWIWMTMAFSFMGAAVLWVRRTTTNQRTASL